MTGACIILHGFLIPNVINYSNQITVTPGWSRDVAGEQACETTDSSSEPLTRAFKAP